MPVLFLILGNLLLVVYQCFDRILFIFFKINEEKCPQFGKHLFNKLKHAC